MAVQKARISLAMYDNEGNRSTFLVHANVSDALTIANAKAAIDSLSTLVQTVSDGGVHHGTFSLVSLGAAAGPGADADVSSGAVFDFASADASIYGQYIPSFLDSLVSAGGHINVAGTTQAAFVSALIGAVLGGNYANARYINLSAGTDAFLSNRKRTRRIR